MRRLILAAALLLAVPAASEASPCTIQTLDSYIGFGSGGCDVGGANFFDFSSAASFFGGTEISASDIVVTPTSLPSGPQLAFGFSANADATEILGVLISYSASNLSFTAASLALAGSGATGDGVVTVVQDLCLSGSFGPDPTVCSGTPRSLVAAHDAIGNTGVDSTGFLISSFFDVFVDITLDGGLDGSAFLRGGSVTNAYTAAANPNVVPEPASLLLLGSGLLGMAARRRRRTPPSSSHHLDS